MRIERAVSRLRLLVASKIGIPEKTLDGWRAVREEGYRFRRGCFCKYFPLECLKDCWQGGYHIVGQVGSTSIPTWSATVVLTHTDDRTPT